MVNSIDVFNGKIGVSPSHPDDGGGRLYTSEGLNVYNNNEWSYIKQNDLYNNRILDITYVYFDRMDSTRMWASSLHGEQDF